MITLKINGKVVSVDGPATTPLLWVIRDVARLKGTKFGCGIGMCGACTVHVNGRAVRSCITSVGSVVESEVTTIEGLEADVLEPFRQAWLATQAPQCGYCQPGQIMQAATLVEDFPTPTDADINAVMSGNLCRCMAYVRIRKAIKSAAEQIHRANAHG